MKKEKQKKLIIESFEREHGGATVETEYETCVLCGALTNVPRNRHIDFRDFYVEGCGQLCYDCGKKMGE